MKDRKSILLRAACDLLKKYDDNIDVSLSEKIDCDPFCLIIEIEDELKKEDNTAPSLIGNLKAASSKLFINLSEFDLTIKDRLLIDSIEPIKYFQRRIAKSIEEFEFKYKDGKNENNKRHSINNPV